MSKTFSDVLVKGLHLATQVEIGTNILEYTGVSSNIMCIDSLHLSLLAVKVDTCQAYFFVSCSIEQVHALSYQLSICMYTHQLSMCMLLVEHMHASS